MAAKGEPVYYSQLPAPLPDHYHQEQQHHNHYIILPLYRSPNRIRNRRCCLISIVVLILLPFSLFFLWPSNPSLKIVRLRLNHVRLHTLPLISLDISLALTVKVRNRDFFSLDYDSLVVSIGYRGRQLGFVTSGKGHLKARGSSYVDATLKLNGIRVLNDAFFLIEDLAKGSIPFDTVTEVQGKLGLFFIEFPIKAKVSCEVYVNVENQKIISQDCYSK